jgi:hypothetical protein
MADINLEEFRGFPVFTKRKPTPITPLFGLKVFWSGLAHAGGLINGDPLGKDYFNGQVTWADDVRPDGYSYDARSSLWVQSGDSRMTPHTTHIGKNGVSLYEYFGGIPTGLVQGDSFRFGFKFAAVSGTMPTLCLGDIYIYAALWNDTPPPVGVYVYRPAQESFDGMAVAYASAHKIELAYVADTKNLSVIIDGTTRDSKVCTTHPTPTSLFFSNQNSGAGNYVFNNFMVSSDPELNMYNTTHGGVGLFDLLTCPK